MKYTIQATKTQVTRRGPVVTSVPTFWVEAIDEVNAMAIADAILAPHVHLATTFRIAATRDEDLEAST